MVCEICGGTKKIRFGGIVGKNPGLTAPCAACAQGSEVKRMMKANNRGDDAE